MKRGEFWNTANYIYSFLHAKIEQGDFSLTKQLTEELFEFGDNYDYDLATLLAGAFETMLLLRQGQFHKAKTKAKRDLSLCRKHPTLMEIPALGRMAECCILLNDIDGAREAILQAKTIVKQQKFVPSALIGQYLTAQFMIDIQMLKDMMLSNETDSYSEIKEQSFRNAKTALKKLRNYAPFKTRMLLLMGEYFWLLGDQTKAFKWWEKSIKMGEKLGARPDLSRTYCEIVKSLLEPKSKYKEFKGMAAKEYLEKAEALFKEMDLERDLSDLETLKAEHGL